MLKREVWKPTSCRAELKAQLRVAVFAASMAVVALVTTLELASPPPWSPSTQQPARATESYRGRWETDDGTHIHVFGPGPLSGMLAERPGTIRVVQNVGPVPVELLSLSNEVGELVLPEGQLSMMLPPGAAATFVYYDAWIMVEL